MKLIVGGENSSTTLTTALHPTARAVMPLQEFAPATTCIPNEIPMENPNWNSHGRRSKQFDSAHRSAPATAKAD